MPCKMAAWGEFYPIRLIPADSKTLPDTPQGKQTPSWGNLSFKSTVLIIWNELALSPTQVHPPTCGQSDLSHK